MRAKFWGWVAVAVAGAVLAAEVYVINAACHLVTCDWGLWR